MNLNLGSILYSLEQAAKTKYARLWLTYHKLSQEGICEM